MDFARVCDQHSVHKTTTDDTLVKSTEACHSFSLGSGLRCPIQPQSVKQGLNGVRIVRRLPTHSWSFRQSNGKRGVLEASDCDGLDAGVGNIESVSQVADTVRMSH